MVSSFSNLDLVPSDGNFASSRQHSGTNYDTFHGGELFAGNSVSNPDIEFDSKNDQFLSTAQISQKRTAFEKFINATYKDHKQFNRHFDKVKTSLGTKIEQVFVPETMLEYFDRISQRPFSRIANTNKTRWTDDEVLLLTHIMIYYSYAKSTDFETLPEESWIYVASIFPNKEANQLKKRWQGCLKKTLWQIPWTQPEDELLEQILNEKGHTRKWKEIAEELNARSEMEVYRHGRQCRERWNNHLDPNIARGPFTEEEDARLFQLFKEIGKKWAEISKKMKTRTENAVKNRFNSLIKKLKSRQNTFLSENLSMMSTESDADSNRLERKLVDNFLQQYEAGGGSKLSNNDEGAGECKNEMQEHSESIFESDSDSGSKKPKKKSHLGANQRNLALLEQNKRAVRSLGELNEIKGFLSNSAAMEEEYSRNRGIIGPGKNSSYDNLDLFSNSHAFCQSPSSHRLFQNNSLSKQTPMMGIESPTRARSSSLQSLSYQMSGNNASRFLPNSLFDTLNNQSLSHPNLQNIDGKFPSITSDRGYKAGSNPLLNRTSTDLTRRLHPNYQMPESGTSLAHLLEVEETNLSSPNTQTRFHFEGFDNRLPRDIHLKLDEDFNDPSPIKKIVGTNHPLKAKKLDKNRTQNEIGQSNMQYAIVDLTKNEVYMVHPVTKDNYHGTLSKMNEEDSNAVNSLENISSRLKNSELLMLGKSGGDHSPSLSYLQSLIAKSGFTPDLQTSNANLQNFLDSSSEIVDKSKNNSVNQVERRFQDIKQMFEKLDNHDVSLKNKASNAETSMF